MENFPQIGKIFVITGIIFFVIGILLIFFNKIPFLGKLPGDIVIKRENFTIYIPIVTSLLISLIISIIFFFIRRR